MPDVRVTDVGPDADVGLGEADATYPLQKKGHTLEFLREVAHLRAGQLVEPRDAAARRDPDFVRIARAGRHEGDRVRVVGDADSYARIAYLAGLIAIVDAASGRVYGLALRIVRRPALAEEVVEDVFWQVWREAPRFDAGRGKVLAWLLAIARSRVATLAAMVFPAVAAAQAINIDLGTGAGLSERVVQMVGLLTVLSLAPSIIIMTTSFVRIVVVLSLLRTALGLQQSPPNAVIISLALFLSAIIMARRAPDFKPAGVRTAWRARRRMGRP